ncbi:extracellular solute-binding protein [Paenibacillus sp. SYP-B3998]|uniref:Extracellular solute-binding protein n=1 Tax=Paenibacillus sp. SYP-B3998 TaxID=2678564 RepID=A0A6G3ZY33_9BACL|nr:extracellular solute-binding protein [Paenibacillus sp. SYP-B3998]NEW07123.1 extracellular solute-binding protein [Paenibacillus sp. SYP-B3998]
MKTKRRSVFVTMTMVLIGTALLGACTNEKNTPVQSSSDPTSSATVPRGKITATIYERGDVPKEEGTKAENRWTKWINQNGPVDVTFVSIPRWESGQKLNTLFASNSAPDLIAEYDSVLKNQLYAQKQLLPLDDYIDKYSTVYKETLAKYPKLRQLGLQDDGKLYGIGRVSEVIPQHLLYIRTDWLKKLNLQAPTTLDDFFAVTKAFAEKDPDGNNKKDTYGMNLSFVGGKIVDAMFGVTLDSYDKNPWILDSSGKLVFGWDRLKASLDFKKKLYDAGTIDKDYLTDGKGDKAKQDFINGKLGIWGTNSSDIVAFKALKKNNPKAEITTLPLPSTPFGQFSPLLSQPVQMISVVNAKAKDPAAIIKFIDFMNSNKASTVISLDRSGGLEGTHYKIGPSGCAEPMDLEKNKKELGYIGDFTVYTRATDPANKCSNTNLALHPIEPSSKTPELLADYELNKQFAAAYQAAFDAYTNKSRPMVGVVSGSYLPALPQDLALNQTNGYKSILDILSKSAIGGNGFSSEKALKDSHAAWETSNGTKVEEWMADWFSKNKDKVLLTKDYYDFMNK